MDGGGALSRARDRLADPSMPCPSSRSSLEFGMWLDDPQALQAAKAFLVQLMAHSEALDPDSDVFEPELLPVDFDE
jgi:hypothetical protein